MDLLQVNNLHQLRSTLSLYPGTEQRWTTMTSCQDPVSPSRCKDLGSSLEDRLVALAREQGLHLLASLALAPIVPLLEERDGTPLATVPGCLPQVPPAPTPAAPAHSPGSTSGSGQTGLPPAGP